LTNVSFDASAHITTERLLLRPLRYSDSEAVFSLIAHDRDVLKYYVMQYSESIESFSLERTVDFFSRTKRYAFAIDLIDSGKTIGIIHQCSSADDVFRNTEIGYALGKKYWNHGYMTEALDAFINFLFEKNIHKITCSHIVENTASGRVMQKCGMIPEDGVRREELFYNGRYCDIKIYYKLNPEY